MKTRRLWVLILCFLPVFIVYSDDGSWNNSFSVQGGSIYSEKDNPDIVLEKELLIFDGTKTTVFFQFRNTKNRPVTLECGFPVRHVIETVDYGEYLEIPVSRYGGNTIQALNWFETRELYNPAELDEPADSLPIGIILNEFNNSREFIPGEKAVAEVSFTISQDGSPVPIRDVLLERRASGIGAAVIYHFRHNLVFGPGKASVVRVEYSQDLVAGSDGMSDSYRWDYVIGTGATWNGSIGSILVMIPSGWKGDMCGLERLYESEGFLLYGASNYEPGRTDTFNLRSWGLDYMSLYTYREEEFPALKEMWETGSREVMQEIKPAQDMVKNVSASSFLTDRLNAFNEEGVIDMAAFDPSAAFDGLGETSWCEGAEGDGIGEYIECTLSAGIWALKVKNGYTRFPAQDWMFDYGDFEDYIRDDRLGLRDYFTMNNRVKQLKITSSEGKTAYTLDLEDRRDPQTFCGIFLEPGRWRFTISSVYSGTRWQDTCLSEISFITEPASNRLRAYLDDPFFRDGMAGIYF